MKRILTIAILALALVPVFAARGQSSATLPVNPGYCTWVDVLGSPQHVGLEGFAMDLNCSPDSSIDYGASVLAILPGRVLALYPSGNPLAPGCGIQVDIWHQAENLVAHYCHLAQIDFNTLIAGEGSAVFQGQQIGFVGDTGGVPSHLHFSLRNANSSGVSVSAFDPRTLPAFASIPSRTGGGGGPEGGIGDIPGIGNLKLEVQWPSIPIPGVGQKTLNELVEGAVQIHLGDLVRFLYAASLWIAGIIALIALVYAGLMYLISGQSPVMRSRARDRVVGVLMGAAILFAAVIFLNVLNPDFTNLSLELDRQFETRDTPGAPTEEGTIDTTGKYAPIPFASRSTTQTLYPDCSSAGITSDESQTCLKIAGAIIVDEPSDDTQVSCAAVCMLLAGDSADCKSQRGTVDGLTPPSLKHDILHAWNTISGADGGEGWTPDSVTGIYGNTNSPDNEDFADHFEDLIRDVVDNSAGRVCVANYVDVAADAPGGWTWDACFCK